MDALIQPTAPSAACTRRQTSNSASHREGIAPVAIDPQNLVGIAGAFAQIGLVGALADIAQNLVRLGPGRRSSRQQGQDP